MNDIGSNKALELLSEVRVIVGKLEVHIEGNGGKGLLQRQEAQEFGFALTVPYHP
jgi:hypothetical protein